MRKGTLTTARTSFLTAIDGGDKMRNFWGGLPHINEYLTIKNLTPTDVFGTEEAIMESAFQRKYGGGSLAQSAEKQLFPVILLRRARYPLVHGS